MTTATERAEHDYQKALRAWHVAWQARVDWHREYFEPLEDREQSVVYEEVLAIMLALASTKVALLVYLRTRAVAVQQTA